MSGFLHLIPISAKKNERCLLIFKCSITVYSEDMHSVAAFPLKSSVDCIPPHFLSEAVENCMM